MAVSFSRTARALETERGRGARVLLLAAMALFLAWAGWFFLGRINLYEVSRQARIEVTAASRTLAAEHGGRLVASGLYIGRRVRAGEVLAELDAEPQKLRLAEAEARLAGYPARIAAVKQVLSTSQAAQGYAARSAAAAVAMARAQSRAAQADAAFTGDLARRLDRDAAAGGVSPIDAARSSMEASKAAAAREASVMAETRVAGEVHGTAAGRAAAAADAEAQLAALTSEWNAASAMVEQLRRELDARRIRAPVDGVIGDVSALRLGDVLGAGTRLATIVPGGALRIVAEFNAARGLGRLTEGQPARLRLTGFAWTEFGDFPARVERVGAEPNGDLLRVELRLPPAGLGELPLRHGMEGQVDVLVETVSPAALVLRTLGQALA
ncbi:HlyD family secretion protein [Novosphingobium piscinae]|uniref:HlyD family efflux transporter periplasmic adaptor subunit n=1 Tax=Novosphingobium piscinae TaxID=1507448 RepID=A0A7X1FZ58_9SPHN|nr:HlyD family efflux transporter periplasmic adaptor subunit [Novosphingobium piscinae]MBC2669666.1 HlyD family efflux transporter periplasmic adaptor subunit [Novosphingobium piscinae]